MSDTIPEMNPAIYGLVLAGGRSSRMGRDKGLIVYNDKPQREYIADLLRKFCAQVYVSCKTREYIPAELNPLPDQFELESPLNGILSAFRKNDTVAWLTVPVDMPYVDEAALACLLNHRDTNKMATCFVDSDGKHPEPLLALWEARAAAPLKKYYESGGISPREFLKQQNILLLQPPDKRIYQNINTPDELNDFLNKS
ncbi:molybdenum cofactor guanylyltransferase [Ohtaekwangia kribbensis]|jgi:molybdopterin-guanine dinucleotide biosynthesis protein A|uniref:Probable molybdenum cofactor guanylyltransferase n=2 Tax=Ohtaekwangia kribbensis TaxID=688913 RepID=A0ABW3K290_9BACT